MRAGRWRPEAKDSPGAGDTGGCEPLDISVGPKLRSLQE